VDDSSASIGKKYARNDELGTPFGCTVDFASTKNGTITLRSVVKQPVCIFSADRVHSERDSTAQLIGPIDTVVGVVQELVKGTITWEGASERLESYSGVQDVE
jgi:glycyl-tRNA synthetase